MAKLAATVACLLDLLPFPPSKLSKILKPPVGPVVPPLSGGFVVGGGGVWGGLEEGVDGPTEASTPVARSSCPLEPPCATVMKTKARTNRSPIHKGGRPPPRGPLALLLLGWRVGVMALLLVLSGLLQ